MHIEKYCEYMYIKSLNKLERTLILCFINMMYVFHSCYQLAAAKYLK